ncbi:hypothetical protein D9M68_937400 [compost metagenome]
MHDVAIDRVSHFLCRLRRDGLPQLGLCQARNAARTIFLPYQTGARIDDARIPRAFEALLMMIEAAGLRVPYTADIDGKISLPDFSVVAGTNELAAGEENRQHHHGPDIVGVEFS